MGAAPGLFVSRLGVAPEQLGLAIRDVAASAERPAVRAYLERRRSGSADAGEPVAMAVVVQRQVDGTGGVLYTRPPGRPDADEIYVEAHLGPRAHIAGAVTTRAGRALQIDPDLPLSPDALAELVHLGLLAERAIDAQATGADVEWVAGRDRLWLVQARPITQGPAAARTATEPSTALRAALALSRSDPRVWRWDASHNPDPLSPAQTGLVELVADLSPVEMRVVAGYLYTAPRPDQDSATGAAQAAAAPLAAAEVEALFARRVRPAIEQALAPVEHTEPPGLEAALAAYRTMYIHYAGELAPALSRARAALEGNARGSAIARAQSPAALREMSALAPAWDVAAPSFGESPDALARATAALHRRRPREHELHGQREPARPGDPGPESSPLADADAGALAAVAEADDLLFFRAQHAVRRALLALAAAWRLAPADDIFFLPLALVRARAREGTPIDPALAHRLARAARAARAAQAARAMPLAFQRGRPLAGAGPLASAAAAASAGPDLWRGQSACRGSARGPALILGDLGQLAGDPRDRIVVASSVSPATLIQLVGAAGLVCEQGGALDHAAALARELDLPCVVGCAGARRQLRTGDELLVDGDAGLVIRLAAGSPAP